MSGSLSDLLTTGKNIVTGVSTLGQNFLNVSGVNIAKNITTTTLVKQGAGRVVRIVVLTTNGASTGSIYDSVSVAAAAASGLLWTIAAAVTASGANAGPIELNLPFRDGLVIAPGTGMTVVVSYS